jgi:energy-coupling factor transporter ATP-binding protein EcfA2
MSEPDLVGRQNALLADLVELVRRRRTAGEQAESRFQKRLSEGRLAHEAARQAASATYAARRHQLEAELAEIRDALIGKLRNEYEQEDRVYQTALRDVNEACNFELRAAKKTHDQARWEANTVYDAKKHVPRRELKEREKQIQARQERILEMETIFHTLLADFRRPKERRVLEDDETIKNVDPGEPLEEPAKQWQELGQTAETTLGQLKSAVVPALFRGLTPLWLVVGPAATLAVVGGFAFYWNRTALIASGVLGLIAGGMLAYWLWQLAGRQTAGLFATFSTTLDEVENLRRRWLKQELVRTIRLQAEIKTRHDVDLQRAETNFRAREQVAVAKREEERARLEAKFSPTLKAMRERHEEQVRNAQVHYPQRFLDLEAARDRLLAEADDALELNKRESAESHAADWREIADVWNSGVARLEREAGDIMRTCAAIDWGWDDPRWTNWEPGHGVPPVIRYGQFRLSTKLLPSAAIPADRLAHFPAPEFDLPAMLPFPERSSVLVKTSGSGRAEAVQMLQTVMMRFLTTLPAGKVRFTIIDPVGLGQNFAGFMHLADYDEKLVSSRIWTEPAFIEQRLAEMTSHMSNVIQKYLRNEYDTIEDYNREAGEVAEPYRVLVVANFPFNISDNAARHLMSIVTSGQRCGVYTLISVDMKLKPLHGFNLVDLEQNSVKLVWKDNRFITKDGEWEHCPLVLDPPPPQERFIQLLNKVGERAKEGSRVEVPFEFIAPRDDQWWSKQSATGIDVPLGRAGATKRQPLQLGRGTSQHVLIAGKTGSGKSTLMHALITNLALYYSPEEVELYLIDFKKGVEFKTYATHQLPHARVVAIESEREFGLSVLQRLDAELKVRGDLFRELNVQDVGAYREATGKPMPRILLVVDEFQEFFVEDDKISQEVSLLLDRLVRQGRAFGIHIHLGSQTLGGAYGLARATLGQMAVRVALQCSEADSHLILSEDNPAARLLTRPGEAIYNDANGRVEGNNLFQVVWLSDDKREDYLKKIHALATERKLLPAVPQIVFEGNAPAELEKNVRLTQALAAPTWPEQVVAATAWLGEAIAIKDPTSLAFRRQGGSNVVLIGQQPEAALSIETVSLIGLATQHDSDTGRGASFFVLDGSPPDAKNAGYWQRAAGTFPHRCTVGGVRDTGRIVGEIADEVARRQADPTLVGGEIYLVIHDLQRFRDLRKAEDDFSFGRADEKPNPAKQLANILREGPALGIHAIIWCDSLTNFQRTFDRSAMREFETRIVFQVSQNDSSNLIDSPLAARLGPHRALLFSEEQGRLEKFRPYGLPDDAWLAKVKARLAAKRGTSDLTPAAPATAG